MKYENIVSEINDILSQYTMKLTVRQIYYRLVSKLLIPNTKSSYKGLDSILVKARERGHVDWRRIEDRSRQVLGSGDHGFMNPQQFLEYIERRFRESVRGYTRTLWDAQPKTVMLALEKDALSRLFTEVADPYRIHVYATRGYGSFTYLKNMAEDIIGEKPTIILYFGDYDPSGRDIERDLTERLYNYGAEDFKVERIAITPEQIKAFNLPPRPEDSETLAKLSRDPRTASYGMEYAVELDAIEPKALQDLILQALFSCIDLDIWNEIIEKVEREREELETKLDKAKIVWE